MNDIDDKKKKEKISINCDGVVNEQNIIALKIDGKDQEIWQQRNGRFLDRIINSFKKMIGHDIPSRATAVGDIRDAAEAFAESASEKLKSPLITNQERLANIQVKLAEAKEKEANARFRDLEGDKLELELERERIHDSQKILDILIQRGDLTKIEHNGEIIFIFNKL